MKKYFLKLYPLWRVGAIPLIIFCKLLKKANFCFIALSCIVENLKIYQCLEVPMIIFDFNADTPLKYSRVKKQCYCLTCGGSQLSVSKYPTQELANNSDTIMYMQLRNTEMTDMYILVFNHLKWNLKTCEPLVKCNLKVSCNMKRNYKKSLHETVLSPYLLEMIHVLLFF